MQQPSIAKHRTQILSFTGMVGLMGPLEELLRIFFWGGGGGVGGGGVGRDHAVSHSFKWLFV